MNLVQNFGKDALEEWRDIKGFEGHYQVSNLGNVRSLDRQIRIKGKHQKFRKSKGVNLVKTPDWDGYLNVGLCLNGKVTRRTVHRLVAMAFIPNPENKATVNHKDSNRANNKLLNLEWATISENAKHGYRFGNVRPPSQKGNFKNKRKSNPSYRT